MKNYINKTAKLDRAGKYRQSDRLLKQVAQNVFERNVNPGELGEIGNYLGEKNPDKLMGVTYSITQQPLNAIVKYLNPSTIITDLIAGGGTNGQNLLGVTAYQLNELIARASDLIKNHRITDPQQIFQILSSPNWKMALSTDPYSKEHERVHVEGRQLDDETFIRSVIMPNLPAEIPDEFKYDLGKQWAEYWKNDMLQRGYAVEDIPGEMAAFGEMGGPEGVPQRVQTDFSTPDFQKYLDQILNNENPTE